MNDRPLAWVHALAALGLYDNDDDKEPTEAITVIESLERSRAVRRSRGFRLLRMACQGRLDSPPSWVIRFALGRAIADLGAPTRNPNFELSEAAVVLRGRAGGPLQVLAQSSSPSMLGGVVFREEGGTWTVGRCLASWLVQGELDLPVARPQALPSWLQQQQAVKQAGQRLGDLIQAEPPPLFVLSGADPLLGAATAAAACQHRGRPLRCWALDLDHRDIIDAILTLRWAGAVDGFDALILPSDHQRRSWTRADDVPAHVVCQGPARTTLWVAVKERVPNPLWLRDCSASLDLEPLRPEIGVPQPSTTDQPPAATSPPPRTRPWPRPFDIESTETSGHGSTPELLYTAAERLARLAPFQAAVFPDHQINPIDRHHLNEQDDAKIHIAPERWQPTELTLEHLVLTDQDHGALDRAAKRAARGERCVILLHGPPGTGKSMAARGLAGNAGLPVYDLQTHIVRDPFHGESDRRLAEIFDALAARPAVLVIDEADAWLGRREGSASQAGACAVIECSNLLVLLEHYQGTAVLTTNRLTTLDPALQRRVDLDIHLARPELTERMALWASSLCPHHQPRADELCLLASVPLSGGDIHSLVQDVLLKNDQVSVAALLDAARQRASRTSLLS